MRWLVGIVFLAGCAHQGTPPLPVTECDARSILWCEDSYGLPGTKVCKCVDKERTLRDLQRVWNGR